MMTVERLDELQSTIFYVHINIRDRETENVWMTADMYISLKEKITAGEDGWIELPLTNGEFLFRLDDLESCRVSMAFKQIKDSTQTEAYPDHQIPSVIGWAQRVWGVSRSQPQEGNTDTLFRPNTAEKITTLSQLEATKN